MSGITRARVGEVLQLERRPVEIDPFGEYVEIGVRSFGKGVFQKEPVSGAELGDKRVFQIEPGDLVISNVFAWEGAIAIASESEAGTIGSHRFMTFVPTDDRINARWACWFLRSEPGLELIRKASPGSAGRNKTLAVKRFEDLIIPLPQIVQQRRVAARLDHASAATAQIDAAAERGAAVVAAFAPSIASMPNLSLDRKLAGGWREVPLRSVMTQSQDRTRVEATAEYPNVGIYSFGRGMFEKPPINGGFTSATTLFRIRARQFIYSRLFAFEGAYATVPERFDGYWVSNEFPSFDVDEDLLDALWLTSYLRTPERWADLGESSIGLGVRRQRVPVDALLDHTVLLPPIEHQRRAVAAIERLDRATERIDLVVNHAKALVPALLNQEFAALVT